MSKINLMIDVDNTISQTIKYVICDGDYTGLGIRPKYEEIVNPDLFSIYGKNIEYVWPKVFSGDHTFIKPVDGAVYAINRLKESGLYNISINTAREERFRGTTEHWLNFYGIGNIEVNFTASGHKYDNISPGTIIIEDNIMELKNSKNHAIALVFDVPWSKTYAVDGSIKVIKNWNEVLNILVPAHK